MTSRGPLLKLLTGTLVLVGLLTWWGGWALPVVVFAVILMIMGHEFGHFITAKRAGMRVTDYFVGFGPVVWSTTRGETRYGVRAFPVGGYVKVPGMSWSDDIDPADEPRTYRASSYPRKVLFASAGSLMHIVMALALAFASLTLVGLPSTSHVGVEAFTPWDGHAKNAAQLAGLHVGDRIVSIDDKAVTNSTMLVNFVHHHSGQSMTLVVERAGRDLTLHATPVDGRSVKVAGQRLATGKQPVGYIGIELYEQTVRTSVLSAIPSTFSQVGAMVGAAVHGIVHVFSPGEFASLFRQVASPAVASKASVEDTRPLSIVGVARLAVQGAQSGTGVLLEILMAVNVFVGLLNMIPILPLDGGYVAVATYERLRSRRGQPYHADINKLTPLAYGFMTVLLFLFACTLYLDVVHPIANPFR